MEFKKQIVKMKLCFQMKEDDNRGAIMRFKTKTPKEPPPPNKARY
jgi:hypothetical protein